MLNNKLNAKIDANFNKVTLVFLIPALLLLISIGLYFIIYDNGDSFINQYVSTQTDLFFYLNHKLSKFPNLQINLTQLGDALIFYPIISIFIIYGPKLWESLLTSSIISIIISALLKKVFAVPRPAAMLNHEDFTIIGKTLSGKTSLPSGHSICAFIIITTLFFAFMPQKNRSRILWTIVIFLLGGLIVSSRVGVGAHYPLDVIIGSAIGFIISIIGIKINNKIKLFHWINNKNNLPIFVVALVICAGIIIKKLTVLNLPIFYISLLSTFITLLLMIRIYVKKNK
jgi:membrane-associated phospholipid phosphatase